MEMTLLIFWGILLVLTVLAEVATMQLVSIWFSVGACGAILVNLLGFGFLGQLITFVVVSALLLLFTRPLLRKIMVKKTPPMNAEKDIGETAVVIEEINADLGTGRARINGVDWIALSEDGSILPKGTVVVVRRIDGAKLIVCLPEQYSVE